MAVVKFDPPSLLILAIISVFKVGVATFSSNTTILLVVGTEPAAKAFEVITVDVAEALVVAVSKTYPSLPVPAGEDSPFSPGPVPSPAAYGIEG